MFSYMSAINAIESLMDPVLDGFQMAKLHAVLEHCLLDAGKLSADISASRSNQEILSMFIGAKRLEGCSSRTLGYYESVLCRFVEESAVPLSSMSTDTIRSYLTSYQQKNGAGNTTVDNVRRVISSLFSWMEVENLIYKSPARRIKKIRSPKGVKPVITDEAMVRLRDGCSTLRDLAMIDLLASTGMRVGELVRLNKGDIDFENRECVVKGKGSKERKAYFDARAKIHLLEYLSSRNDESEALFVSLNAPHNRLAISGIEGRLRRLGDAGGVPNIHPHKFRRTLATRAIDKGMPIEQVQVLLGHSQISTTLCYAMVDQQNVRLSHKRFIG